MLSLLPLQEAAQEQVVSEARVDDADSTTTTTTAPTLPNIKNTAQVVPTLGAAAGKETCSSSKKQAKEIGKQSDKAKETDKEDADEVDEEEDPDHVWKTQHKQKRASTSHVDASPDDAYRDQPKGKVKTVTSAEFKPPFSSGSQPSRGTASSPNGGGSVAGSLSARLAKVAAAKKK